MLTFVYVCFLCASPQVPEIGGFVGRPSEAYHMVTQHSRLQVIKEQSKAVFQAQRDAHSYDMKVRRNTPHREAVVVSP